MPPAPFPFFLCPSHSSHPQGESKIIQLNTIQWSPEPKTSPRIGRNRRKQGQPKDGVRSRMHFILKKRQKGVCFTHSECLIRLHILSTKVPSTCTSPSKSYRSSLSNKYPTTSSGCIFCLNPLWGKTKLWGKRCWALGQTDLTFLLHVSSP